MGEVYIDVHEHIENRSDNEDARRPLIFELVLVSSTVLIGYRLMVAYCCILNQGKLLQITCRLFHNRLLFF